MVEERIYTIPLRSKWVNKPRIARVNVSVDAIRHFLEKHMKTEEVKLSPALNESLWTRGAKKPPASAKVKVVVNEKGIVMAMLPEEKVETVEKRGLKNKLLRQKGEQETKLVKGGGKPVSEPKEAVKPADKKPEQPKPIEQKPAKTEDTKQAKK